MPGWTLTVDLPIEHGLDKLCDALDDRGGRSRRPGLPGQGLAAQRGDVPQMYPRLEDFLAVRREVDPDGIFNSDLARRLELSTAAVGRCCMINAVGAPQSLLLLGGTSDIALAIARRYARAGLRIVLAARPSERRTAAATELKSSAATVTEVDLDARDHESHAATIDAAFAGGDIDIAVIAFGLLGDAEQAWQDPDLALELAEVNYAAPVHLGVLLGQKMRAQAHGWIVALSSVAGERVRRSNFVYGSTKAGFDGFFLGLGEALAITAYACWWYAPASSSPR